MDYDKLIEQYRQAADKWEKRHPITDTFDLRVQDALRDAATAIEILQADLARVTAERDAAIKDIWVAKWTSCKYGEGCDFISARTGCPDCAICGDWEWRGLKEDKP